MSSFFDFRRSITSLFNQSYRKLDPSYKQAQDDALKKIQFYKLVSIAASTASVFFGLFGIQLVIGGPVIIGCFVQLIAFPAAFLSYNASKVLENLKKIVLNPMYYSTLTTNGVKIEWRQKRVTDCLLENTFLLKGIYQLIYKKS